MNNIGLGCDDFSFAVYIGNTPNMLEYQDITTMQSMVQGEISAVGQACGNGWRKVFNVYAKVLYGLDSKRFAFTQRAPTWQQYRDNYLLQNGSHTALLFNSPIVNGKGCDRRSDHNQEEERNVLKSAKPTCIHIICGKTYAKALLATNTLPIQLTWLDHEFAIDHYHNVIVCPYFDYRQLSNDKIERLSELISTLFPKNASRTLDD